MKSACGLSSFHCLLPIAFFVPLLSAFCRLPICPLPTCLMPSAHCLLLLVAAGGGFRHIAVKVAGWVGVFELDGGMRDVELAG